MKDRKGPEMSMVAIFNLDWDGSLLPVRIGSHINTTKHINKQIQCDQHTKQQTLTSHHTCCQYNHAATTRILHTSVLCDKFSAQSCRDHLDPQEPHNYNDIKTLQGNQPMNKLQSAASHA